MLCFPIAVVKYQIVALGLLSIAFLFLEQNQAILPTQLWHDSRWVGPGNHELGSSCDMGELSKVKAG